MAMNSIMGIFAKSPFKPLEEHIRKVHECAQELIPFFEAVEADDWDKAEQIRAKLSSIEHEADELKREIRLKLPSGIFLPVDRTDLLELVTQQDKIANRAKDIAGRVTGRQLQIPSELQTQFNAYLARTLDATKAASKAVNEFDELIETGFVGREVSLVEEIIHSLDKIEDDTDVMQRDLRIGLYQLESQYPPIDVMVLYKIIEWIGDLADQAERVGTRLEMMLARN